MMAHLKEEINPKKEEEKKMKKLVFIVAIMILISLVISTSFAVDTSWGNGTTKTINHFRIFSLKSNDLSNGKPLVVFFATDEESSDIYEVVHLVNKYYTYDDLDINLICVAFKGTFTMKGWVKIGEELADYLKQEYDNHPVEIILDCASNGSYGGCCLAQGLQDRGIIPKELNIGNGIMPRLITVDWLKKIAGAGTQVNLYASSTNADTKSPASRKVIEELNGTENFYGEVIGKIKHIEVLARAIHDYGLHSEYRIGTEE